ncbi:MAG: hypothetical protein M1482_13175, partial [Chloroflexi bacterium]|nr:hypothetical protein [Chloroflexota bacterium]
MPPPPWNQDDYREGGEIRGYSDERWYTAFQVAAGTLSVLDRNASLGIYWAKSADQIPYYETAAPLLQILDAWMRQRGRLPIHAGAVGLP